MQWQLPTLPCIISSLSRTTAARTWPSSRVRKISWVTPNHENIFTQKFSTQKYYNTKISQYTVHACTAYTVRMIYMPVHV